MACQATAALFLAIVSASLVSNHVEGTDYVAALSFSSATSLPPEDDGISEPILIRTGFPIGSHLQYYAYVGTNGIISFGKGFRFFTPSPFPTASDAIQDQIVIAPFWTDNDVRMSGNVSYQVFNDPGTSAMENISNFVSENTGTNFMGTWMLLAEWSNVHPFPHGVDSMPPFYAEFTSLNNTYQAVLITNDTNSYAVFTYRCGEMFWSGDMWGNYSTIGYSIAGEDYFNHAFTNLTKAHLISCLNSSDTGWSNVFLELPVSLGDVDVQKKSCEAMIREDNSNFLPPDDINSIASLLESCPCSQTQARNDWKFRADDSITVNGLLCYFQRFPSSDNASQYCCYASNGALTQTLNETYGTNMAAYHPLTQMNNYMKYDRTFRETCCNAGLCSAYTDRRPSDQCQGYQVPSQAWGVGNIHFTTLDGLTYTFNGLGDYLLLNNTNTTFQVQMRTKQSPSSSFNATQIDALIFGEADSFVEVTQTSSDGNILLHYKMDSISIKNFLSLDHYENGVYYSSPDNTIRIQRTGKDAEPSRSVLINFANGLQAVVNVSESNVLYFTLRVPESFREMTTGLLGNFNGNAFDDLTWDNMTVQPDNATDEQVHAFGESWSMNTNSWFIEEGTFGPFTPTFPQEVLKNATDDVNMSCDGNVYCIFDAVVNGSNEFGLETEQIIQRNAQSYAELGNFPPQIRVFSDSVDISPNTLLILDGNPIDFVVIVIDANGDNFMTSLDTVPTGLVTTNNDTSNEFGNYSFSWSIGNLASQQIMITSTDVQGASSQILLQVFICVCENGGTCPLMSDMAELGNNINFDASTVVIPCECNQAWTGPHCSDPIDGCSEGGCFGNSTCTDSGGIGVVCTDCGSGLVKDGQKCYDFDDCPTLECEQMCVNNLGSNHTCLCYPGYQMSDDGLCKDIDECDSYSGCHQVCNNTNGSFICSCEDGYTLTEDGLTCEVKENATCSSLVEPPVLCANDSGTVVMSCISGYIYTNGTCVDIDECELYKPCNMNCTNTMGSFDCSCDEGFELGSDNLNCQDIDECLNDALTGNSTLCPENQLCQNTIGWYVCECPPGTFPSHGQCNITTTTPSPTPTSTGSTMSTESNISTTATVSTDSTPGPNDSILPIIIGSTVGVIIVVFIVVGLMTAVVAKICSLKKSSSKIFPDNDKERLTLKEQNRPTKYDQDKPATKL